jgi:hypothetical protein
MEKHLLTEINRMKGMMGLTLLSEQAAYVKKLIQAVTGVSDESAQSIAKSADEVGSEFGTALKQVVGGAGTYDDLVSYVSRQGGSVKSVDDIVNFVKSRPDLLKKIATSSDVIMKRAAESVFATSKVKDLFNPTSWAMVNKLLTSNTISAIDSALKQLEQYKGKNSELDDLIQKLKDRKSIAEKMKSTPSVKVVDNVGGKSEMINFIDGIEDIQLKSDLTDVVSKISDDEMKQIDDIVSKIPKEKEGEFIDLMMNKVCSINESRNIGKLSNILTESKFDKGCNNFSKLIKLFDKDGRVPRAIFKMMLSIFVLVVGSTVLVDLGAWFFNVRKDGYKVPNPFDSDGETPEGESGGLGPDDY